MEEITTGNKREKMTALVIGDKYKNRDTNSHLIKFIVWREALARMFSQQMKSYNSHVYIKLQTTN